MSNHDICPTCHAPRVWCACAIDPSPVICPECGHLYAECYHGVNAPEEAPISAESQLAAKLVEFDQLSAKKDAPKKVDWVKRCARWIYEIERLSKYIPNLTEKDYDERDRVIKYLLDLIDNPFPGPVMTAQEWGSLSAQARHNLNVWAMNANRTSEELERAQDKLDRILAYCMEQEDMTSHEIARIINEGDATPGDVGQVVEGMKRAMDGES